MQNRLGMLLLLGKHTLWGVLHRKVSSSLLMQEIGVFGSSHRRKRSLIKDCRLGMPWIGTGAGGNPVFMSANEVCVLVAMVMDVQARWGRCHHCQWK